MVNVSENCDFVEIKTKLSRTVIKFDDKLLGNILGVPATGSKFFETKKWPEDPKLVLEDCLRVFYPNTNVFEGMAKPTNWLGAEHRLLHHITATHILPTSGGHEKMSYQDFYIMWHVVTGKPLNLPYLIVKNMPRATSKVEGALPYGMVITKIISHFGIIVGNEVASRIDVGDIYNASSLKGMGWKRVFESGKNSIWLPKEGGKRKRRVEGEGVEEKSEAQRPRPTPAQQARSSSSSQFLSVEMFTAEMRKMNIKMDNTREEILNLFYDKKRSQRRLEKKLVAKGVIETGDISSFGEEEESEEEAKKT
ncbi:hypothetical protein CFOL_v3_07619 [Cephalotus follicularis]|uniref:Putative plant transposon protein domain-containing protein n=1 Tax=Cephalotus follicularis TaxID=3775 RepID=A0A1Q3B7T4_CEPFO|nr:hypothetical protein CFOL_v3_07619 [Cephalotus follicularis]